MRRHITLVTMSCAISMAMGVAIFLAAAPVRGHEADENLPAGPIRERHELMEGIGAHAKKIGGARKTGDVKTIAAEAAAIHEASQKIVGLFPEGSTHEKSRAKPEIWEKWDQFKGDARDLVKTSKALEEAARSGGDVNAASQEMFGSCKSCHDAFRVPEED